MYNTDNQLIIDTCGCPSLKYISIPKSVICLNGNPFFKWDGKLECLSPNFIYEDDVLFNKDKSKIIAFRDKNTTSYIIPDSVTSIGDGAFDHCSALRSIVIPDSVTSIGKCAFEGCYSLKSLVIPDSVTSIGKGTFKWCKSLDSLMIPDGVTGIEDATFCGCESLSDIVIPDGVTGIGDGAFFFCNFPNDLKQELISRFGKKIFG